MKIAILSDVHGNRQAFGTVLADALGRGAERFVILGDIVGYGGDPVWCVETCMDLVAKGAIAVRGNHDQAIGDPSYSMNSSAGIAIDWTRLTLEPRHRDFLARLPVSVTDDDRLYVHAEGSAPARFTYVNDRGDADSHFRGCAARLSFCGHVHAPALYGLGAGGKVTTFIPNSDIGIPVGPPRRWLAVIGSVGQPRDGNPAAAWALYDTQACELSFRWTAYDIDGAASAIRAASLPESLATRLYRGR
ncbi:MAG: metallophosphoesterase family protein [Rhizobium sp.]|nr:metallophosphoesterase family protein [Rhizobium sp.]